MEKTYGYHPLSYSLIELFRAGEPDFDAAEELIRQGADVNAQGDNKQENVLSEILWGYGEWIYEYEEECDTYESDEEVARNSNRGKPMIEVIQFFLAHGFDVTKDRGRYGAQCLSALSLSTYDKYIIAATKILLNAGARDISLEEAEYISPMEAILRERDYLFSANSEYYLANIYEAVLQMYIAIEEGHSYWGIDSFETAIGKKVIRIMADSSSVEGTFFTINDIHSKNVINGFSCNMYIQFDGGYLITDNMAGYWVDTRLPEKPLVDVSTFFADIIEHDIKDITFPKYSIGDWRYRYGKPFTSLYFDNGAILTFITNLNEGRNGKYHSYFYFEGNEISI